MPRLEEANRGRLHHQLYQLAEFASPPYVLDLLFAAGIATLGLVLNSPAVVIGAMLISPLMGPILAVGLAFAASDIYLAIKSAVSLGASIVLSVCFSAGFVWLLPFQSPTAEILARTQPNLLDLGVAIFSGLAGSFAFVRSAGGGASTSLPGVAIAVALMPPLCTVGFGVGSGFHGGIMSGALLLFLTNLIAIAASAFVVFYLAGMSASSLPEGQAEADRRHATGDRLYGILRSSPLGQLRWRVVMILATLALLFVPLRASLQQLKDETLARNAAREVVRSLAPSDQLLGQQLELLPDSIMQNMVTTATIGPEAIAKAEAELARRTGKRAVIRVRQVASEEEVMRLRETLMMAPLSARAPSFTEAAAGLRQQIYAAIDPLWPSAYAELLDTDVRFNAEQGTVLVVHYRAQRLLEAATQAALEKALRDKLGDTKLVLQLERVTKARG